MLISSKSESLFGIQEAVVINRHSRRSTGIMGIVDIVQA